jgi:dihydrofolate reductase
MGRVVVLNHITLDGVMQAPGRADEDTRGGFVHGGWAAPNIDELLTRTTFGDRKTQRGGGLLFGRWSYEAMLSFWNTQGGPFKDALLDTPKYVASKSMHEPLPWPNSTLFGDDVPAAVARLKAEQEGDLLVMGSGVLIETLMQHDLIDEYQLMIHPIILGSGRRLFAGGSPSAKLRLIGCTPNTRGVLMTTYEPAR